ncbi:MAG: hypothetical protein ACO3IW_14270, partial [Burkholderiales bacterium]
VEKYNIQPGTEKASQVTDETVVSVAPQVEADPTVLIVFALVFVGLIGTYAYIIWKADQKKKGAAK